MIKDRLFRTLFLLSQRGTMKLLLTVSLLFLLAASAFGAAHDFTDQCGLCHLSNPKGQSLRLAGEVDTLCRTCHDQLGAYSHPSQLTPSMAMPAGFWLDEDGQMNCATCHTPHPEAGQETPYLLRTASADIGFCRNCHTESVSAEGKHLSAVFIAHSKRYTDPRSAEGQVDSITADCISCHDGSGHGQQANFCLLGQEGQCAGHVVGLDYDNIAASKDGMNPRGSLSPLISFYEGKVGCASCHSLYSLNNTQLTVDNRGSTLCLNCHNK